MEVKGVFTARGAGRLLALPTQVPPLRAPQQGRRRGPELQQRVPSRSDAHAVNRNVLTSCGGPGGLSPGRIFGVEVNDPNPSREACMTPDATQERLFSAHLWKVMLKGVKLSWRQILNLHE